mmetsp:Transcript_24341/g.37506  ORF Transcript_24341/g.37506 Transcript_24341/m.37506 type:complete len:293 (-) Transcript_24341:378-1256(-)
MAITNSVDQYEDIADAYKTAVTGEPLWAHTTDHTIKALIGGRPALEGKSVLDLACGEGIMSRWAAEKGAVSVVGVDLSEPLVELARESLGPEGCAARESVKFRVADLRPGKLDPKFHEHFDVVFAVHCFCYAQNESELRGMVSCAASSLKPGGRLVGVRECLDSASRGPALNEVDTSRGQLRFAYGMACSEVGGDGVVKLVGQDWCTCNFEFCNSDGSTYEFQTHMVSEATMLKVFRESGLEVVSCGPKLAFTEEGKGMFDEELQRAYLDSYGKLMWYFDLTKSTRVAASGN